MSRRPLVQLRSTWTKIATLCAAVTVAFTPSPASAGVKMDQAITATLLNNCLDYDALIPPLGMACATSIMADYGTALGAWKADAVAAYNSSSWWNVARVMNLALPLPLVDGSPYMGGGGATDDIPCPTFDFRISIQGTLIVPTVELEGGGPMLVATTADPTYKLTFGQNDITHGGSSGYDQASSGKALSLWALHWRNRKWTSDFADPPPQGWAGCYALTDHGCLISSVPYQDHHGSHWMADGAVNYSAGNGFYSTNYADNKSCPEGGFSGGDVHFYIWGPHFTQMNTCTWYIPNKSISPSGYYYPTEVALPGSAMANFPDSMPHLANCHMAMDLVKAIAEKIRQRAETAGAEPTQPITEKKTGPAGDPTVDDLGDTANLSDGSTTTPQDPTGPNPTDPGSGGEDECDFGPGGCENPNTPEPTLGETPTGIMDPIFDWLPDLPSITFPDTSGAECPVWNIDMRDFDPSWQFLMDSHCDVAETVREALGTLMVALFGIWAAFIILRA